MQQIEHLVCACPTCAARLEAYDLESAEPWEYGWLYWDDPPDDGWYCPRCAD